MVGDFGWEQKGTKSGVGTVKDQPHFKACQKLERLAAF